MWNWLNQALQNAEEAERQLLREMNADQLEQPDWSAAVSPVLNRMMQANRVTKPIQVRVLSLDILNAFALPHRTIILSQPLVSFCEGRRDELAFVLAHELAHITLGHANTRRWTNTALTATPLANPLLGMGLRFLVERAFSREQEYEADATAARTLHATGYTAAAGQTFLHRLRTTSTDPKLMTEWLQTHPPILDRIAQLQQTLDGLR
jgi:Zn-dependent protease with chaperone function